MYLNNIWLNNQSVKHLFSRLASEYPGVEEMVQTRCDVHKQWLLRRQDTVNMPRQVVKAAC